ncbi:hypothetical protein ACFE04_016292 [Oxalis oulophora]
MASGSSGRANSGSKGFDFGSDDILCSYEDFGTTTTTAQQDSNNGNLSDSAIGSNPNKEVIKLRLVRKLSGIFTTMISDFQKTRMARQMVFPTTTYTQPDDSFHREVASTVEKTMKKHNENVLRFLEGLSSRLSQLELYCYNLDKSIGEMRNDLVRDHEEGEAKLKTIEKHLQEVHRSVQILRDKQELAETQKELAKLQLAQKESSSSPPQSNEERTSPAPPSESKRPDNTPDTHNQQLALPPPPHQQNVGLPPQPLPVQNVNQQQPYYLPPAQPPAAQHPQSQYLPPDAQYRTPQVQDISRVGPQPGLAQPQVNQAPRGQHFPQYQQQWPPQQVQPPQQPPPMQTQMRPPYSSYASSQGQPTNSSPNEQQPSGMSLQMANSMPMQVPYSGQPVPNRPDSMPYGYGGPGRTVPQQPPPQQMQGNFGGDGYAAGGPGRTVPQQPPHQQMQGNFGGDGYAAGGPPRQTFPPSGAYMMYDSEAGRVPPGLPQSQQPQFPQGGYPPSNSLIARNPSQQQFTRNHPYSDLIEKMVNMGFRGDHVVGVIHRMEESGQPVDFNSVLDRLNVQTSGSTQRGGWSG